MRRLLFLTAALMLSLCATAGAYSPGAHVRVKGTATTYDGKGAEVVYVTASGRNVVVMDGTGVTVTWRRYANANLEPFTAPTPPPTPVPVPDPVPTPVPVPDPTPTPTPTPSGFPDATNTGVKGCPALAKSTGDVYTLGAGQVIENREITGSIVVNHPNVTIRCVKIIVPSTSTVTVINNSNGGEGLLMSHVEIDGNGKSGPNTMVQTSDSVSEFVDCHDAEDCWHIGWNATIRDSFCHHMLYTGSEHADCVQMTGYGGASYGDPTGRNVISHNSLVPWEGNTGAQHANSAIILKTDFGQIADVLIDRNRMDWGASTVYSRWGNCAGCTAPTNVRFTNNRFGRHYEFGLRSIDGTVGWTNNVWDDTGQTIP